MERLLEILFQVSYLCVFITILFFLVWLLLKIFPRLKKLSWKILAILFVIFKIFDMHSTYLCVIKTHDYESEVNFIFRLFYKALDFSPFWAFAMSVVIGVPLIIWLIKIFVKKKAYFFAFCLVFGALLAAIHNYLGYFLLKY